MKAVHAPAHARHDPGYEYTREGLTPYPESPARAESLLAALRGSGCCQFLAPDPLAPEALLQVHAPEYLRYLEKVYPAWVAAEQPPEAVVPVTFALGRGASPPIPLHNQAGYYCYDTTPLVEGTWEAACQAAACALKAAGLLLEGENAAYALCRPPGHHAGRAFYGGYCYLNNAALAATFLAARGRVALLDIDYHHGNGTQDIFYNTDRVLFASLHADPDAEYPFYWGRASERGAGPGEGFNRNIPLPAGTDDNAYLEALEDALEDIAAFAPAFLVVSAGFDIYGEDPLGTFELSLEGFADIGEEVAALALPTLLVQEGGYCVEKLGEAAVNLLGPFAARS